MVTTASRRRMLHEIVRSGDYRFEERETEVKSADGSSRKVPEHWVRNVLMQRADVPNRNGRIYPRAVLERETLRVAPSAAIGELMAQADHPNDDIDRVRDVVLVWKEVKFDPSNGEVRGDARIAMTDAGRNVLEVLRAGGRIGVSSRGAGTTQTESREGHEYEVVQEDFRLKTFDVVVGPSVPDAGLGNPIEERYSADVSADVLEQKGPAERGGKDVAMASTSVEAKEKNAAAAAGVTAEQFFPGEVRKTLTAEAAESVFEAWRKEFKIPTDVELAQMVQREVDSREPGLRSKVTEAKAKAEAAGKVFAALEGFLKGLEGIDGVLPEGLKARVKECGAKGKGKDMGDEDMEECKKTCPAVAEIAGKVATLERERDEAKAELTSTKSEAEQVKLALWLKEQLKSDPDRDILESQAMKGKPSSLKEVTTALAEARALVEQIRKGAAADPAPTEKVVSAGKPLNEQNRDESGLKTNPTAPGGRWTREQLAMRQLRGLSV